MSKQGGSGPDLDKMEEGRGFFYFYTELQVGGHGDFKGKGFERI